MSQTANITIDVAAAVAEFPLTTPGTAGWMSTTHSAFGGPSHGAAIENLPNVSGGTLFAQASAPLRGTWDANTLDVDLIRSDGTQFYTKAAALGLPTLVILCAILDADTATDSALAGAASTVTPGGGDPSEDAWFIRRAAGTARALTAAAGGSAFVDTPVALAEKLLIVMEITGNQLTIWRNGLQSVPQTVSGARIATDGAQALFARYYANAIVTGKLKGGIAEFYQNTAQKTKAQIRQYIEYFQGEWWPSVAAPTIATVDAGDVPRNSSVDFDVIANLAGQGITTTGMILASLHEQPTASGVTVSVVGGLARISITSGAPLGSTSCVYCVQQTTGSDRLVSFNTLTVNVLPAVPTGSANEISLPPSLGSFLKNDRTNAGATKFVSNQNRGNGSGSSPANAQELQAALNGASPGDVFQAVAQTAGSIEFWAYPTGIAAPTGTAANYITLEARQGDGIVLSRAQDFAGARTPNSGYWTQAGLDAADVAKHIWRSVGTVSGGNQGLFGFWIEFDHPHQLVPALNMANLRAPYGTGNSPANYSGPMVHKDSDNVVYIRMQRPHPGKYSLDNKWSNHLWPGHPEAFAGGQISYPVSQNPNNYVIHIFRHTQALAITAGGFFTLGNGINTLGYSNMSARSNLKFLRGVDLTTSGFAISASQNNWFASRRRMSDGSKLHLNRAEWKFEGWLEGPGPRSTFIKEGGGSGAGSNLYFQNCTICDYHELGTGGFGSGHWRFRNCTFWHGLDDGLQVGTALTRVEFGYCYFCCNAYGGYGVGAGEQSDPNPGGWFFHHNIVDCREERGTEWRSQPHPKFLYHAHSPDGNRPHKNYNNTIFWGPDLENEVPMGLGHLTTQQSVKNTGAVPHEVFNNIGIRQVWNGKRYDPLAGSGYVASNGAFPNRSDFAWGRDTSCHPDRSNEFWDYNLWYRDLDGTAAVDTYIQGLMVANNITTVLNLNSMAAWHARAEFDATKAAGAVRAAYSPGIEGNSSDTRPVIPSLDNFPADRFKYRPSPTAAVTTATTASLSGANWWSGLGPAWGRDYFPWDGLAPSPWKGALNPNGTTIPIGVQDP